MTKKELFDRFDIQTRAKSQGNFSAFAYIVIKDLKTDKFIRRDDFSKAYKEFRTFKDAVDFCEKYLEEEKDS